MRFVSQLTRFPWSHLVAWWWTSSSVFSSSVHSWNGTMQCTPMGVSMSLEWCQTPFHKHASSLQSINPNFKHDICIYTCTHTYRYTDKRACIHVYQPCIFVLTFACFWQDYLSCLCLPSQRNDWLPKKVEVIPNEHHTHI